MIGETVTVHTPQWGTDAAGNDVVTSWSTQAVSDVLVAPGPRNDIVETNRPHGVEVRFTLHFPKSYNSNLRGCKVTVRGRDYQVIGDPQPYTLENTPTRWWLPVEVVDVDG